MRTNYAHPVDVIRKYNPQVTLQNLKDDGLIGNSDLEQVRARIQGVESEFDSMTGAPMREVRVGTPNHPQTWEYQEAEMYRTEYGAKVWLDNGKLLPIRSAEGDTIELRTGKDTWDDITSEEGDRWEADYEKGWIRIFARYRRTVRRKQLRDKFLRVTYRHGARGGRHDQAGQTTISSQASAGDTTIQVEDASRLRPEGLLFVGGDEYIFADVVDYDNDEIDVLTRGARGTEDQQHDSGTTVHYCPDYVREAVAARAAQEVLRYEDWVDDLVESGGYSVQDKMSDWQDEWEKALSKNSAVRAM